jgi:predicted nucleic acid-binding protein
MAARLVVDTDVLIDGLRGHPKARAWFEEQTERLCISALTVAELYAGVREGPERGNLRAFLSAFQIIDLSGEIAAQAGLYRRDYGKSHGTGIADATIAATAQAANATLVTLNMKHFPMLRSVKRPYRKN